MNVLLIDDNHSEFLRMQNMCAQLPDRSISISHADMLQGVQRLAQGNIHAVLLGLPLSGYDDQDALKQVHFAAGTAPVIVLSPDKGEVTAQMYQNGVKDILPRTGLTPQLLEHSIHCSIQRMHLEEQLSHSDERYRIISELISDFVWSVRCEPEGQFTFEWITGSFHRLFAAPVSEIDFATDWKNFIHEDDIHQVCEHIRKVYAGGVDGIEFRVRDRTGKIRWVRQRTCPVKDENSGQVVRIYGAGSEITDRVLAEEAYHALIQNSFQELLIFQDSRIVFANSTAVEKTGYRFDELQSLSAAEVLNLIHPDDVEEFIMTESRLIAGKPDAQRQELRLINKVGGVRWVEAIRSPIEYQGRPAVQTIQFDITDRKLAEEQLHYRHAIEGLVTSISTRFINLTHESVDSGIHNSLQALGRFAGVERCYVYLLSSDFSRFVDGYEWCQNGLQVRIQQLLGGSFEPYAWSLGYFKDRNPVYVPCVANVPDEASPEKILWESEGIQSVLAIPLILNNMLFGFWGFDSIKHPKTWSEEDIRLLRLMGDVFVNALARKQTELALRQARQELDITLKSISDALWTGEIDQDGKIEYRYMSPVVEKITRRPIEFFKPLLNAWFHIIHPDDIDPVKEAWNRMYKDQLHTMETQFRIVLPDTTIRWVRNSLTSTRLAEGRVRLDAVLSDITERKRAEEGLRYRYDIEGLVTNLTTQFINVESKMVDLQIRNALKVIGEFTGVGHCFVVMLAKNENEIERRYDWSVIEPEATSTETDISLTPFHWSMGLLRRFETVYAPRMNDLPREASLEKDYWISRGIQSFLIIPLSMDDKLVGYFGFASDTDEKEWAEEDIRLLSLMGNVFTNVLARRKAEETLIEREAQYRLLADGITDVVALHELDGSFVYVSPSVEKLTGRRPVELIGVLPAEVILEEDWQPVKHAVDSRLNQGQDVTIQWRCLSIDGSYVWMESSLHPIFKDGYPFRYLSTSRNISERKQAEDALHEANRQLQISIVDMEQRNEEVTLLNEMGDLLQGCLSVSDVYQIIEVYCPQLFPDFSGALTIIKPSQKLVEAVASWGDLLKRSAFNPDQCWALRRGRIHSVNLDSPELPCEHVDFNEDTAYLCIPMAAQGENLGIFHLFAHKELFKPRRQQLAIMLAERLSLALSNLRLREDLQRQSIRDALTGLYNRRYMETTVERELRQAARQKDTIGFIMMDVDHFKDFNDTYGHGAGDSLLSSLGEYLQSNTRASDIACRYGGDEFVLILPHASISDTFERAEQMRLDVKKLAANFGTIDQGSITISMGVASYPDHGYTMDRLLSIADKALYSAKNAGRDQICIAPRLE